jgi:hypothetical protein
MMVRSWLVAFTALAACQFGDNAVLRTQPDAGVKPDSGVMNHTDATLDAPTSCTTVPQAGCSGPTPACDIHDDGTTFCRGVTNAGISNSHCATETECKAGYTCTGDGEATHAKWCARFCTVDSNCLGDGSRCISELEHQGNPLGQRVCTNACDPIAQTGCPSDMGCLVANHASGDFSDCFYMEGRPNGAACSFSRECRPGSMCVGNATATCTQICRTNANNTCPSGMTCRSLANPVEIGTSTYGYCGT